MKLISYYEIVFISLYLNYATSAYLVSSYSLLITHRRRAGGDIRIGGACIVWLLAASVGSGGGWCHCRRRWSELLTFKDGGCRHRRRQVARSGRAVAGAEDKSWPMLCTGLRCHGESFALLGRCCLGLFPLCGLSSLGENLDLLVRRRWC
jgi:hypothetical protein